MILLLLYFIYGQVFTFSFSLASAASTESSNLRIKEKKQEIKSWIIASNWILLKSDQILQIECGEVIEKNKIKIDKIIENHTSTHSVIK